MCGTEKKMLLPFQTSKYLFFTHFCIPDQHPLESTKDCNGETGLQQIDTSYLYTDDGKMDLICKHKALQSLKVTLKDFVELV